MRHIVQSSHLQVDPVNWLCYAYAESWSGGAVCGGFRMGVFSSGIACFSCALVLGSDSFGLCKSMCESHDIEVLNF